MYLFSRSLWSGVEEEGKQTYPEATAGPVVPGGEKTGAERRAA